MTDTAPPTDPTAGSGGDWTMRFQRPSGPGGLILEAEDVAALRAVLTPGVGTRATERRLDAMRRLNDLVAVLDSREGAG